MTKMQETENRSGMSVTTLLAKIANAQGADGVVILRGAATAALEYSTADHDTFVIELSKPHEMIVLIRFPVGDGRADGVEQL